MAAARGTTSTSTSTSTVEDVPIIVLDAGSSVLRAGFAGDDRPQVEMPALLGRWRGVGHGDSSAVLAGEEVLRAAPTPHLALSQPVQRGIAVDWDDLELLWRRAIESEAGLHADPTCHPVLLAEPPLNPRANREAAVQRIFESLEAPAAYIANASVLALYASGRGSGVLLACGDGVSHAEVIYEGYAVPASSRRWDRAGADVTDALREVLRKPAGRGDDDCSSSCCCLETPLEWQLAQRLKERLLLVRPRLWTSGDADGHDGEEEEFQLPDGGGLRVRLNREERSRPAEVLFSRQASGCSLQRLVLDAVAAADIDVRKDLRCNVILSGGTTMAAGFQERLLAELQLGTPAPAARIRLVAPPERQRAVWVGGSILASLSSFQEAWICRRDYEECGPGVVHRMCY